MKSFYEVFNLPLWDIGRGKATKKFEQQEILPSVALVKKAVPQLVKAVQSCYDEWDQDAEGYDEELGSGGICQDFAEAMCGILSSMNVECSSVSAQVGEQHVYVIAKFAEGVYEIDINPRHYEVGGGYNWKKIPNVVFNTNMVTVSRLSPDPDEFEQYID